MEFSIGGYNIRNYIEIKEKGYIGYKTELYKNDTKIANIYDDGSAKGAVVDFVPTVMGDKEIYYKFVLVDMKHLLTHLKPVLQKGALYSTFTSTHYTAAVGFVVLLNEFKGMVNAYNSVKAKEASDEYYIIGVLGGSWFTNEDSDKDTTFFHSYTLTTNFNSAYKFLYDFTEGCRQEKGRLVASAVLSGLVDWNLSFEDYAGLFNP